MKKLLLISYLVFSISLIYAQAPSIQWQKSLGGTVGDYGRCGQQTKDKGYIFAGYSNSIDGDVTGNIDTTDFWVVKLDSTGALQWQKSYGGTDVEIAASIQQTFDMGYVVSGFTISNDSNVTGNHGFLDSWVIKLDSIGTLQWQKCLGGSAAENAMSVQQTLDKGYILAGISNSTNGDVTGNHGDHDCWVVKLDSAGTLQWEKSLGGAGTEMGYSARQTADGGYIVAAKADSIDGDVTANYGGDDFWVIKLSSSGSLQWEKSFGGSANDASYCVQPADDGGYIVAGASSSNNTGNVTGNHGGYDYWVIKIDSMGTLQWEKCLGGSGYDVANYVSVDKDGGYIVGGESNSNNNGNVTGNHGGSDFWVVKLDDTGTMKWQKSLGGSANDVSYCVQPTADEGYIVTGHSASPGGSGDITNSHGKDDFWVVKLNAASISTGISEKEYTHSIQVYPNPSNGQFIFSGLEKESKIAVYDITGKLIHQTMSKNSNTIIDLSEKEKGMYFYKITTLKSVVEQGKIIIQ